MPNWSDSWLPTSFARREAQLYCERVALADLCARFGTPLYVYSAGHIRGQLETLRRAFAAVAPTICFAVKANDNHGILQLCAAAGAGFDVVSVGELRRALRTGVAADRIVFSGVGKSDDELAEAIRRGVLTVNIESAAEAERLAAVAAACGRTVRVAVRVNPDVDPKTHPKIATGMAASKFGVPIDEAADLYRRLAAAPGVQVHGMAFHIGSQLLDGAPVVAAAERAIALIERLRTEGIAICQLDVGGGFGIRYTAEQQSFDLAAHAAKLAPILRASGCDIVIEPGRFIVGNAGVLCTRLLYDKRNQDGRRLAIVDAAMNDLLRPALYDAEHTVLPVRGAVAAGAYDLVGPVCESSDVLARGVTLPDLQAGDLLAILSAGAYGSTMGGTYNSRPRPAEVLVDGERFALLRPRETLAELLARDTMTLDWTASQ